MAVRVIPILLVVLPFLVGCSAVGDGPPCAAPESYPVCGSARTGVLSCQDGEEVFTACADGLSCLDIVDETSGERLSECVAPTSIPCDPETFLSACVDAGTVLACVAPATHPTAGHTEELTCGEGETCRLDVDHGACQAADAPTPCDPLQTPTSHCDGSAVVTCDADTSVLVATACPTGQVCRMTPEGAACLDGGSLCDPATWAPTCESSTTIVVCAPTGAQVTETCPPLIPACKGGPLGAVCVPTDAEPCDLATFQPYCEGMGRIVLCNPETSFSDVRPCGRMSQCVEGAGGATCQ